MIIVNIDDCSDMRNIICLKLGKLSVGNVFCGNLLLFLVFF